VSLKQSLAGEVAKENIVDLAPCLRSYLKHAKGLGRGAGPGGGDAGTDATAFKPAQLSRLSQLNTKLQGAVDSATDPSNVEFTPLINDYFRFLAEIGNSPGPDTANEAASASTAAADEEDEEGVLFSAKTKMLYQKHYIKKNAKEHDLLYLQKVIAEKKSDANYQVEWAERGIGKLKIKEVGGVLTMILRSETTENSVGKLMLNVALKGLSAASFIRNGKIGLMCSILPNPPLHTACVVCTQQHADAQADNTCGNGCWGADGFKSPDKPKKYQTENVKEGDKVKPVLILLKTKSADKLHDTLKKHLG